MLSFWSKSGQSKAQPAQPTTAPGASVDKNGAVTHHLPGVFVPNCQDGTVIFPTTRRKPSGKKRTVIPPPPTSITNCTLLSNGGVGDITWAPPAAPPMRRPSRCMSVDANGSAIPPEYVPRAVVEALDVGNVAKDLAQGTKGPDLRHEQASSPAPNITSGQTLQPSSTDNHPRSKSAAPKVPSPSKSSGGHDGQELGTKSSVSSLKRPGIKARSKSYLSMHDIVRKVRTHLSSSSRRKGSSKASPQSEPTAPKMTADDIETASICRRGTCQYVLDDSEVQDVVQIVINGMCKHGAGPVEGDQDAALQTGADAALPKRIIRKPSCLLNARVPQVSDAAEPATTISLPETAFFARSQSDGQIRAKVRSSKVSTTTILSKDNVTDIRWGAGDTKPEKERQEDVKDVSTTKPEGDPLAEASSAAKVEGDDDHDKPNDTDSAEQKPEGTKNFEVVDVAGSAEPSTGPRLHEISDCDTDDLGDYTVDNQPTGNLLPTEDATTKDGDTQGSAAINQELNKDGTEVKTLGAAGPKLDPMEESPGAGQADEAPMEQNSPDAELGGPKRASNADPPAKEVNAKSAEADEPSSKEIDSASPGSNKTDAEENGPCISDVGRENLQQLDVSTPDGEQAESKTLKSKLLETGLKPSHHTAVDGAPADSEILGDTSLQKENSKASLEDGVESKQDVASSAPMSRRRGTHEWQSPPYGAIPEEQEMDDMYHLGVDARPCAGGTLPAAESVDTRPDPMTKYNFGLLNWSGFGESTRNATSKPSRRVSEAYVETVRPMNSVATAEAAPRSTDKVLYRSRSAHFADVSNSDPGFLQKLTRKLSSVFQTPAQTPVMRAPAPSLESTAISRKASESHIAGDPSGDDEAEAAGYISEPERSSIYQAMTVSKPAKSEAQRRSICSEDNAPQRMDAVTSLKGLIGSGGR